MLEITLFIGIAILLCLGIWYLVSQSKAGKSMIEQQAQEKRRRKEQIIMLLETSAKITNYDVEAMLGISDATATRYLDELEQEKKVKQVGKTGQSVYYQKLP